MGKYELGLVVSAIRVIFWFVVLFVLVPRQLFATAPEDGERHWGEDVVRMTFATIIIVHVLAFMGLYDFFSLVGSYVLLYFGLPFLRAEGGSLTELKNAATGAMLTSMDFLEGRSDLRAVYQQRKKAFRESLPERLPTAGQVLWFLVLLWVLGCGAYLRLYEPLTNAAPTPSLYLHLDWLKGLGRDEVYSGGLYPYGSYALLSALNQFAMVDEGLLLRATEGLIGVLVAAVIYATVRRFTKNRGPAVLVAALYSIFSFAGWLLIYPLSPGRIIPLELAIALLPVTIGFLADYLAEGKNASLLLFFQGLASVFLIHPLVGFVALAALVAGFPAALFARFWRIGNPRRLFLASLTAVVVGNIFYSIGLLAGLWWHNGPLDITRRFLGSLFTEKEFALQQYMGSTTLYYLALLALPLLVLPRGEDDRPARAGRILFGFCLLLLALPLEAVRFGLPELFSPVAWGAILSPLVCVVLGLELTQVVSWVNALGRRLRPTPASLAGSSPPFSAIGLGLTVLVLIAMLVLSPSLFIAGPPLGQYDAFVKVLYSIKSDYLAYKWTVVSSAEDLPQILDSGWYMNSEYFLQNFSPDTYRRDLKKPELGIPTDHVFIFVEKQVFAAPATAKTVALRDKIGQDLWAWCRRYQQLNENTASEASITVYYEDGRVVVYHIYHPEPEKEEASSA